MSKRIVAAIVVAGVIGGLLLVLGRGGNEVPKGDPETRIITYLQENVKPGRPVFVTDLHNNVFTTREERAVLDRLTDAFFKIPATAAEIYRTTGRIPTIRELSDMFNFKVPGEMDVLLKIMEYDPRMPKLLERNPATGEITSIDVERIAAEPRFRRPQDNR